MSTGNNLLDLTTKMNEYIFNSSGSSKYSYLINHLSGIVSRNSIHESPMTDNGYVFFGKPKLNLYSSSLKQDRILSALNTLSPESLAFAIRCYLDPKFANRSDISKIAQNCELYNTETPYIPVLTNQLESLSGWAAPTMEIETTEGGFFSENITIAKGHNDLNKTITLSATFNELVGFPITNIFMMWFRFIHLTTRGVVKPHNKYIEEYKVFYGFPIYRFVLDVSGKYIEIWSKGTLCFPNDYPIVDKLDFNKENTRKIHNKVTVSITVNFSEYMDIAILSDFNTWVKRACPSIEEYQPLTDEQKKYFLHYAIPYINFQHGTKELEWRVNPNKIDLTSPLDKIDNVIDEIKQYINEEPL